MKSLIEPERFKVKVSSVLNRSAEFAGLNMFDRREETCWNSEGQGHDIPQSIFIDFGRNVEVQRLLMTFQGGFVGQDAIVAVGARPSALVTVCALGDIQDCNDQQAFDIQLVPVVGESEIENGSSSANKGRYLKITFHSSTDFYGRVTIYDLDVLGEELEC